MSDVMDSIESTHQEDTDVSFLEASARDEGYDPSKEPGQTRATLPEGRYRARYEFGKSKEGNDDIINEVTKLPMRWKVYTAGGKTPSKYIATSAKALLLGPGAQGCPLTLEEFDAAGLAGRTLSAFLSSRFMFGRSSLTDWLNSVLAEKVPEDAMISAMAGMAEEAMLQSPEGELTVRWTPYYVKEATEEGGKQSYERLGKLNEKYYKKYGDGTKSKAWPRDEDGEPLQTWEEELGPDEKVKVVAFAEVADFVPFTLDAE